MYFDRTSEDPNDLQAFSPEGGRDHQDAPDRDDEGLDQFPSENALELAPPAPEDLALFAEPSHPAELLTLTHVQQPTTPRARHPIGIRPAATALVAIGSIAILAIWFISRSPDAPAPTQAVSAPPPVPQSQRSVTPPALTRAAKPSPTPTSSGAKTPAPVPSSGVTSRIPQVARQDRSRSRSRGATPSKSPKVTASYPDGRPVPSRPSLPITPPDRIAGSANKPAANPADRGNRGATPSADAPPPAGSSERRTERPPSTEPAPRPNAAAPPSPPPAPSVAREEEAVRDALTRYQSAYERLDAGAAKDVWPSVNEAALARAFENLESQDLSLSDCRFAVTGNRAQAWCQGTARYVRRVGSKAAQQDQRQWIFTLSKDASAWKIDSVLTR